MVGVLRPQPNARSIVEPEPASLRLFLRYLEPLPPPDSLDAFDVHHPSDRKSSGEENEHDVLKPFIAIQRVQLPPGKGAARQPEASLAWVAVTPLVKRRQQTSKPWVSLEIMFLLEPSACWDRGQHRRDRQWRGLVGPAGVWEQGKGVGWIAREPERSGA
jgi:hypothetical protein